MKFQWEDTYFQFTCLPNGLACAPRLFTKLLKPVYTHIRSLGHTCMGHIDDSLLVGYDYSACQNNIVDTVDIFCSLGFIIHPEKSILEPTQEIEFLGFLLNSVSMTIRLPPAKASYVKKSCVDLQRQAQLTIRELAHVIGLLVSSLPGVQFGELHYRQLEINKTVALQKNKGNYDAAMHLTLASRSELTWWIQNVETSYKNIIVPSPDIMLTTDASTKGWGAVLGRNKTGGLWDKDEREYHINYLEMKAVILGLQSLCGNITQKHIRILSDNTTTVAYINAMGGVKSQRCNEMAQQIWNWCIKRDIWLSACHIPQADTESRKFNESTEWSLDSVVFDSILALWGPFQIDSFASRLNFKVANYVSWKPDPGATFINAFLMNWQHHYFYAFPPFSLISTCLQKIEQNQASGVLLVPVWKTQP